MFLPNKLSRLSVGEERAYPMKHGMVSKSKGWLLTSPAYVRFGCKCFFGSKHPSLLKIEKISFTKLGQVERKMTSLNAPFRKAFWHILRSSYDHLMIILQSSYDHLTIILWSSYNHLMIILRSSYDHLTIILRSSYDHLTIILWSSYDHLTIILQ